MAGHVTHSTHADTPPRNWYARLPLYVKIAAGLALGVIVGQILRHREDPFRTHAADHLQEISTGVLRLLGLLATPLVFLAVIRAVVKAAAGGGRSAAKLTWLVLSNTTVAILIGLLVANVIKPGTHAHLANERLEAPKAAARSQTVAGEILRNIPSNFIDPLQQNDILPLIIIAVSGGIALRIVRVRQIADGRAAYRTIEDIIDTGFDLIMVLLQWVLALVPVAVFAVVAATVTRHGFAPLKAMLIFIVSVLTALLLQACFYLVRLRLGSWVRPGFFFRGASDAMLLAFSTASSSVTLPVTYKCAKEKLKLREESVGLGVMVGHAINHDGTALYEAMAALFIAQAIGLHLTFAHQIIVVLMSIVASVGAAGIPEAGTVTLIAVFRAVNLPVEYIPLLLPVDWFLDRCRTSINCMGDLTVTCLLDGKTRSQPAEPTVPAPSAAVAEVVA